MYGMLVYVCGCSYVDVFGILRVGARARRSLWYVKMYAVVYGFVGVCGFVRMCVFECVYICGCRLYVLM